MISSHMLIGAAFLHAQIFSVIPWAVGFLFPVIFCLLNIKQVSLRNVFLFLV